jgi:hypothetical protein
MNRKQQLLLERQLRKCKKELDKLMNMEGFDQIDIPTPNGMRKMGDKLSELILMLDRKRL